MPLSSVLGAQSLVRPGVCTSSTRPASPFEGQLIFETDTNRVVAYDGSAWVYAVDTDQPPGLQLIKTQTIGSAVSSVTVSDVFSSDFDNYFISVSGGVGSTTSSVKLTLGSTTSGYYQGAVRHYFDATSAADNVNNGANWVAAVMTANTIDSNVILSSPNLAKRTTFTAQFSLSLAAASGFVEMAGGFVNDTTQYTSFTFAPTTGTMTGGTIRVYGYRNS